MSIERSSRLRGISREEHHDENERTDGLVVEALMAGGGIHWDAARHLAERLGGCPRRLRNAAIEAAC
jgi:hypothetical protein